MTQMLCVMPVGKIPRKRSLPPSLLLTAVASSEDRRVAMQAQQLFAALYRKQAVRGAVELYEDGETWVRLRSSLAKGEHDESNGGIEAAMRDVPFRRAMPRAPSG